MVCSFITPYRALREVPDLSPTPTSRQETPEELGELPALSSLATAGWRPTAGRPLALQSAQRSPRWLRKGIDALKDMDTDIDMDIDRYDIAIRYKYKYIDIRYRYRCRCR